MPVALAYDPRSAALYHPERQNTVFEKGQTYSIPQLAVEAARLAYYRAERSAAERARLVEALGRVGFADLTLFGDPGTGGAAFAAARTDGTTILSFRGTQPDNYKDLITDLRANLVPWPESAGLVHNGFAVALRALRPQILEWIRRAKPDGSKLILTGHSLGAAMATLAATIWRPAWLVTIGSPRVGDAAFVATVLATRKVRFVDCCDAVTEVPAEFGGYRHVGDPTYLTRDAGIVENPEPSFVMADRLHARIDYASQYAWQVTKNVPVRDLADHAPVNYARVIFGGGPVSPKPTDRSAPRNVDLMFSTTRERSNAPGEYFSGERSDSTYYGKASVRVPEERSIGQVRLPFELKIFSLSLYKQKANPRTHFILESLALMESSDWLRAISSSGHSEALVFVHGFNVSFLDAVYRCAQIAWDIQYGGVPILYSWASRGELFDYGYDRNSALVARSCFVKLLQMLQNAGISRVHILAHSMGNFAVLDALATHDHLRQPLGVGEVLMAAPDIDSDQYRDIAPKVRAATNGGMTLYASSRDRAMTISKALAGHVPRAGDVLESGPVLVDGIDAIDVTAVGDDIFGLNHGVFATGKSILNDVKLLISQKIRPPSDRLAEIRGMPEGESPSRWWRYVH